MAKTYSIDVSAPANSTAPSGGAAAIRLLKNALHERNNLDHYWEKSGDTADVDNVGYHRKATLLVQSSAPTAKSDAGIIYSKDVDSKAELFYRDEDGDEVQLTSGGAINVSAAFVATDFILTALSTKTGWTDVTTTYAGRYLRIGATALATGGSATHTHAAGSYAGPSHTHTGTTAASSDRSSAVASGANAVVGNPHTHTFTSAAGGTGAITGTSANGNNAPIFVDVRMFQKD